METLKNCRTCEKEFDCNEEGIFWHPYRNHYFSHSDVDQEVRDFPLDQMYYFCDKCYIKHSLAKLGRKCSLCGVWNGQGSLKPTYFEKDDDRVIYTRSMLYKVIGCLALSNRDEICVPCISSLDNRGITVEIDKNDPATKAVCWGPTEKEKCDRCGFMEPEGPHKIGDTGVASDVDDVCVGCGYGSRYDYNVYNYTEQVHRLRPPELENVKVICDDCIDELLEEGVIQK